MPPSGKSLYCTVHKLVLNRSFCTFISCFWRFLALRWMINQEFCLGIKIRKVIWKNFRNYKKQRKTEFLRRWWCRYTFCQTYGTFFFFVHVWLTHFGSAPRMELFEHNSLWAKTCYCGLIKSHVAEFPVFVEGMWTGSREDLKPAILPAMVE